MPLFGMSAIGKFHSNIFINDFEFINAVVLVSLLVSLKILHKFFTSFYYLPWTGKYLVSLHKNDKTQ